MKTITFPIAYTHRQHYVRPRIGDVVVGSATAKPPKAAVLTTIATTNMRRASRWRLSAILARNIVLRNVPDYEDRYGIRK